MLHTPFDPNIYHTIAFRTVPANAVGSADVAWTLFVLALLSGVTFALGSSFRAGRWGQTRLNGLLYGWLADLVEEAAGDDRFVTAFVLTTIGHDGTFVGYEGLLENLTVNADKEITSVSLLDATSFVLVVKPEGVSRVPVDRSPIPRIYFEQAEIQNIAFSVIEAA